MATQGHENETINVAGLKSSLQKFKDDIVMAGLAGKADKTDTVSNVSYNSSTGKLQQTINGETTDVTSIVTSGFAVTEDDDNGIDELTAIGSATIVEDNTNGLDELNF